MCPKSLNTVVLPEVNLKNSAAAASWHDFAYSSQRSLEWHRPSPLSAHCLEEETVE